MVRFNGLVTTFLISLSYLIRSKIGRFYSIISYHGYPNGAMNLWYRVRLSSLLTVMSVQSEILYSYLVLKISLLYVLNLVFNLTLD